MIVRTLFLFLVLSIPGTLGRAQNADGDLPPLKTIESLNLEQAIAYARKGVTYWDIPKVKNITDEAFEFISREIHTVVLSNLNQITETQLNIIEKNYTFYGLDGIKDLNDELAERLGQIRRPFSLDGLEKVSDGHLEKIVRSRAYNLSLNGLKSLTPNQAKIIGNGNILEIQLRGIENITDETLKKLLENNKNSKSYDLSGLKKLTNNQFLLISNCKNHFNFDGISFLSDSSFSILMNWPCTLSLNGLTALTPFQESCFIKSKKNLDFRSLKSLSHQVAKKIIKQDPGHLYFRNLLKLPSETASELGKFKGEILSLSGLETLNPESAREIAGARCFLVLDGLKNLTPDVAHELARHLGPLALNGLESLSLESARELSTHIGQLELRGLTWISDPVARELAKHMGGLSFQNLQSLTPSAFRSLILTKPIFDEGGIPIGVLKNILSLQDREYINNLRYPERPNGNPKNILTLGGMTTIPALGAKPLGKITIPVEFPNVSKLSDEEWEIICATEGYFLFPGISVLTDAQTKIISRFKGHLEFSNLNQITEKQARELIRFQGKKLDLEGYLDISEDSSELLQKNRAISLNNRLATMNQP